MNTYSNLIENLRFLKNKETDPFIFTLKLFKTLKFLQSEVLCKFTINTRCVNCNTNQPAEELKELFINMSLAKIFCENNVTTITQLLEARNE